ncbi:MAG: NUDIX hydrolase, partial [Myxococcota bacterium]
MRQRLQGALLGPLAKLWDRMPVAWRRRLLFATNDHFLIGVVGLLTDQNDRVLLLEHRFRTPWRWGLPGGFINRGESINSGLKRELLEEVGLAIEVDPQPLDW